MKCPSCGCTDIEHDEAHGAAICTGCGHLSIYKI